MSKLEVDKIDPQSGTDLELGSSGDTITVPTGVTLDASNATTTLPSNIVTTDGTQTLTNKSIAATQLTGTVATSNLGTGTADATTFLRGDQTYASATPAAGSITTTQLAYNPNQFRNIIINGDMSIAQRGTSATGLGNGDAGYHTVDRWRFSESGSPTAEFTQTQSTDVPSGQGFSTSLKMDCTTAQGSLGVDDSIYIEQRIEGQNLQYLKKGTSNAESLTVSFWVKSNVTGDYSIALYDNTNNRIIGNTYTISTADTWEKKTITFAGDNTGTLVNTNVQALRLWLNLLAGTNRSDSSNTSWQSFSDNGKQAFGQTVNLADNTANEWYITGVQLEAGTSASDFEFLPYDVNLTRCQRYFYQVGTNLNGAGEQNIGIGQWYSASEIVYNIYAPTTMRTKPSLTTPTVSNGYRFHKASSYVDSTTAGSISDAGNQILAVYKSGLSGGTGGQATFIVTKSSPAKVQFSAEL